VWICEFERVKTFLVFPYTSNGRPLISYRNQLERREIFEWFTLNRVLIAPIKSLVHGITHATLLSLLMIITSQASEA